MTSLRKMLFSVGILLPMVFGAPAAKTVKDGKVSIEGTVTALADFDLMEKSNLLRTTSGLGDLSYVGFDLKASDGTAYSCETALRTYPTEMQLGDTVTVQGNGSHTEAGGQSQNHKIEGCKIASRQPGPAKHVTILGTIVEHTDFPARHYGPGLPSGFSDKEKAAFLAATTFGPSDSFQVESDGKVYSCLVTKRNPEFQNYRIGDKISIAGVLVSPDSLKVEACRVVSHGVGSTQ